MSGRCGNCMQPFSAHISRREAPPICRKGGVYREATEEDLDAVYKAAFPDGPTPIATFHADNPEHVALAKSVLSPEAMQTFFGPHGSGITAFMAAMEDAGKKAAASHD